MILEQAEIKEFKSITDSEQLTVDASVTCLVGKNESGKTAVLEALYRLNPLPTGHKQSFEGLRDYPRRTYNRIKESVGSKVVVSATFQLQNDDLEPLESMLGKASLSSQKVNVVKTYDNEMTINIEIDEPRVIAHVVAGHGLDTSLARHCSSWHDFIENLREHATLDGVQDFLTKHGSWDPVAEAGKAVSHSVPKFLYFDDYSIMPGRVSIAKLQATDGTALEPGERTALSLLRLAGVDAAEFTESEYEARKAALEAAANQLSDEVFEFWSQNKDLAIELDVDFKSSSDPIRGEPPFLDIRVRNDRHRVTLNFGERSQGFMWFFSFLAAFSEFRGSDRTILLLDEPGLGLHAAAQGDLLRFIDERLCPEHQVIYTTHSPFMVEPSRLDRVRTVEDVDGQGTKVSSEALSKSKDTIFPLQAALGYDLAQTLFVGKNNLLVEGPADYLYLQVMSGHLKDLGLTSLDDRWVIVPAGGLDKIPTFIALLGAQLNVAVIFDVASGNTQRIQSLVQKGLIAQKNLLPLADFTGTPEADLEDMFADQFYLKLLNSSGCCKIDHRKIKSKSGRLVKRIESVLGVSYDHYRPARYFLEKQVALLKDVDQATLQRFAQLFERANALLGE